MPVQKALAPGQRARAGWARSRLSWGGSVCYFCHSLPWLGENRTEPNYMIDAPDNVVETGHVQYFLTHINYGHYGRSESVGINHWHPSFLQLAPTKLMVRPSAIWVVGS